MPPPHHHHHHSDSLEKDQQKKYTFAQHRALLKTFFRYYLRHKILSSIALLVVIISPLLSTCRPILVYSALDRYLPDRNLQMLFVCLGGIFLLTA